MINVLEAKYCSYGFRGTVPQHGFGNKLDRFGSNKQ